MGAADGWTRKKPREIPRPKWVTGDDDPQVAMDRAFAMMAATSRTIR